MFFNILKKDLKRKKSMNFILLIFITLCTVFLASSINNLRAITGAVDYFGKQSNLADYFILVREDDVDDFAEWLSDNELVSRYSEDTGRIIGDDNIVNEGYIPLGVTTLSKLPAEHNLILDSDNKPIRELKDGECALSYFDAERNKLKIGDKIQVNIDGTEKTFTLAYMAKDFLLGSQYVDQKRISISDADYESLSGTSLKSSTIFSVITDDTTSFEKGLRRSGFNTLFAFDSAMIEMTLTMDITTAAVLMVVGVCLIVIALVVLRFTIVFTLQDDYREIGIMKAIGIKNSMIKKLYIIKYLMLAVVGSLIGTVLSIPFGNMFLAKSQNNIAIERNSGGGLLNFVCGAVIVFTVMLFCYLSTRSVEKFTAIQAIRGGATGERFTKGKSLLKLHKSKAMPTSVHLSLTSIFSAIKSYAILLTVFTIGTLLIILPLNAVNTLTDDSIIETFTIPKYDIYIVDVANTYEHGKTEKMFMDDIERTEKLAKENGAEIKLDAFYGFTALYYTDSPEDGEMIVSFKSLINDAPKLNTYLEGTPPVLPNEIALTEKVMNKLGVVIGDTVKMSLVGRTYEFIITGSFQSMNNLGNATVLATAADVSIEQSIFVNQIGNFVNRDNISGQRENLKQLLPEKSVQTAGEYLEKYLGSSIDAMNSLKGMILTVVLLINWLITILLMKTFITREKGEISLMKNMGFTNFFIKKWQVMRIAITLLISVILGILLSNVLNPISTKYTFGVMGADKIPLNINYVEVFLLYPLLLFVGTVVAAIIGTSSVNKIDFREINNSN